MQKSNKEKKVIFKDKQSCNQCGKQLYGVATYEMYCQKYCADPKCPNYGINQFSVEEMVALSEKRYKIKLLKLK